METNCLHSSVDRRGRFPLQLSPICIYNRRRPEWPIEELTVNFDRHNSI
jgi:hypothetical protein